MAPLKTMLLDNPFLTRERRQLERRPRGVQFSLLLSQALLSGILVLVLYALSRLQGNDLRRMEMDLQSSGLLILNLAHTSLCGIAAAYGGFRLFTAEDQRSTLEPLRLLPMPPSCWLGQKLVFPFLCSLIVCAAGIPHYILAALCGLTSPEKVLFLLQKPILASVGVLLISMLATPDFLQKQRQLMAARHTGHRKVDMEQLSWGLAIYNFAFVLLIGLMAGEGLSSQELPFYAIELPEFVFWLVGLSVVGLASVYTAQTVLHHSEPLERRAHAFRIVALLTIYLSFVGMLWQQVNWWLRAGAFGLIVLFWLLNRIRGSENRSTSDNETYIQWISRYCDNPLLIHDLRVFGRASGIRRYLFWSTCGVLTGLAALLGAGWYWGPAMVRPALLGFTLLGSLQVVPSFWGRTQMFWQKEWLGRTLPQLLLTPLSEREIVLGRLAAVPLFHWVGLSPLFLIIVGVLIWSIFEGDSYVAASTLSVCPIFLSTGAWFSSNLTVRRPFSFQALVGDGATFLLRLLQTVVMLFCIALFFVGIFSATSTKVGGGGDFVFSPVTLWFCSLLLFGCNAVLCWAWIQLRISQLRNLRQGDIDDLNSAILSRVR